MNGNGRCGDYRSVVLQQRLDAIQPARGPTKYQLTINLKTAKALGLTVPSLLVRADEVMEIPTSGVGTSRT
jgi:putative tryptophan/tyrosine transport system substrate-binding protein